MERHFRLNLLRKGPYTLVVLGGVVLVIGGLIAGAMQLPDLRGWPVWVGLGVAIVIMVGVYYLAKKVGRNPVDVALTPDRLTVHQQRDGSEEIIRLADVVSYKSTNYNGEQTLLLRLSDGRKKTFKINTRVHDNPDYDEFVAEFEAVVSLRQETSADAPIIREKTFFERPISTVVLVLLTAFMAFLVFAVLNSDRGFRPRFFFGLVGYASYVVSWYAARERRRE